MQENLDKYSTQGRRAVECDNLHHAWRWDNEADSESGPIQCAKAIRQRSALKAEVSE